MPRMIGTAAAAPALLLVLVLAAGANAEELYQPEVLTSAGGKLDVTLTVALKENLDGTRKSPQYNDGKIGPTLRVKPGDVITLTLVNNLPPSSPEEKEKMEMMLAADPDPSSEDFANVTKVFNRLQDNGNVGGERWGHNYQNIHLHGIQVNPSSADTRVAIDGGETKVYTVEIPSDHPAGFGWYHNHNHGSAVYSMLSGLYGVIEVLEPTTSPLSEPAVAAATPVTIILAETSVHEDKTPKDSIPLLMEQASWSSVVNGQLTPTLTVSAGETVFFRAVSASIEPDYKLAIEGHTLMPVATDGHPHTGATETLPDITIVPGGRSEFLAKFDAPGTYSLTKAGWNINIFGPTCGALFPFLPAGVESCISYDKETVFLQIVVEAHVGSGDVGSELPESIAAGAGDYLKCLETTEPSSSRNVSMQLMQEAQFAEGPVFQLDIPAPGTFPGGYTQMGMSNMIAHPTYTHPVPFRLGSCETWEVMSYGAPVPHPFHLHGMPFLVTHENGNPVSVPVWRDVYHTPVIYSATAPPVPGGFTAKVCFTRYNSYIMAHCHMPQHQDPGMAAMFSMTGSDTSTCAPTADTTTVAEVVVADTTTSEPGRESGTADIVLNGLVAAVVLAATLVF